MLLSYLTGTGSATQLRVQMERKRKGKEPEDDTAVVRNLAKEFDKTGYRPPVVVGRGIPSSMEPLECEISGKNKTTHPPLRIMIWFLIKLSNLADGADMTSKDHLYVGQMFPERDAFKLHMTLYAIANKFRFLVKKSEPGKILLECSGMNCVWQVYNAKVSGSPCFDIRTLESGHNCSVDERWGFHSHATSNVVGDMVRHRYGAAGGGRPGPGALRKIMMNEHSMTITYWKDWKSREFAMDQGVGNADDSY